MWRSLSTTLAFCAALAGRVPLASANVDPEESDEPSAADTVMSGSSISTGAPMSRDGSGDLWAAPAAGSSASPDSPKGNGIDDNNNSNKARANAAPKGARKRKRVAGFAVPESKLRAEVPEAPSGRLKVISVATHEEADVQIFNDDGSYDIAALHEVDHILKCKRTDTEKPIEPRLYVILSHVYDHFGKPLEIVSGYRNQRKQTSYHFKGSASDIRIAGVTPKKLRDFADSLDAGGMGIGLYPRARFVHIDVRPLPSYRWIDNARPNPNSADKRPPRGWKRKKLQS